jgi:hypothetical protein
MSHPARTAAAVLFLAALLAFLTAYVGTHPLYPPCPTDEAIGTCYWDDQTMGNGDGRSFLVRDGELSYLD